jgi:hypothetical protein
VNILQRVAAAWNRFWFAKGSTESLGILRIFYGLTVIMKGTGVWGLKNFETWNLRFPKHRTVPIAELGDLYRDPVPGFEWIPAIDPELWQHCETIALVAAVLWTIGLFTRPSGVVIWLFFFLPMMHSRFDYTHHCSNFSFVLMLLIFLPVAEHYSLDRFIFRSRKPPTPRTMMSVRMVQVLLTWIYISTFCGKANLQWLDGTIMTVMAEDGMFKGPFYPIIFSVVNAHFLSLFTLFAQSFFVLLIWTKYRRWAWFLGVNLHLGIDMLMDVTTFGYQMMALYISFIHPQSGLTRVYFDGGSDEQRSQVQMCRLLNWFDRITWVEVQECDVLSPETKETMIKADQLIVEKPDGSRLVGLSATREIMFHLPITFLLSFALEVVLWFRKTEVLDEQPTVQAA